LVRHAISLTCILERSGGLIHVKADTVRSSGMELTRTSNILMARI
jgi:hypothetical protein